MPLSSLSPKSIDFLAEHPSITEHICPFEFQLLHTFIVLLLKLKDHGEATCDTLLDGGGGGGRTVALNALYINFTHKLLCAIAAF